MAPLYFLLLIPLLIQHVKIQRIDYSIQNKLALKVFFATLLLLLMLRHPTVGLDTRNYFHIFQKDSMRSFSSILSDEEFGFSLYNKLISLFTQDAQVYIAITAVIIILLIAPTYLRQCEDTSLVIVLFCLMSTFVMLFSGIRQMISVGIGFVAYHFVREKRLIPFFLTVLVALSFHTSAFVLLFMYPLYHIKITKKWLLVVIPVMALIFIFNVQIFSALSSIIERYTRFSGAVSSTGAYTMIVLFILFSIYSFLIVDESKMDSETIGMRNFLLFATVVQMFAPLHTLVMRINYYYIIFIPLLIPKIISSHSIRWKQIAVFSRHFFLLFFMIYDLYTLTTSGSLRVFPYNFFWESVVI